MRGAMKKALEALLAAENRLGQLVAGQWTSYAEYEALQREQEKRKAEFLDAFESREDK